MRTLVALLAALPLAALATVNVNTAQQSELTRVKGIDRAKAKAIIEWRAANGSIDNFTELRQVPGFTPERDREAQARARLQRRALGGAEEAEKKK